MTRPPVRRQPSGLTSVAAGIGAVVLATLALSLVGLAFAWVFALLLA